MYKDFKWYRVNDSTAVMFVPEGYIIYRSGYESMGMVFISDLVHTHKDQWINQFQMNGVQP